MNNLIQWMISLSFLVANSSVSQILPHNAVEVSPSATPTNTACNESKGKIAQYQFASAVLNKPFYYRVYTPPCFNDKAAGRYPVLYMLHGSSYNDDQWDRLGLDDAADSLIDSGNIAPLIIVMPQETAYNEDTHTARFGQALLTELIPTVEKAYPAASKERGQRAIGGLSRGAGWAMHLGLANPDLFVSVGAHSLAVFPGDYYSVPQWRKKTSEGKLPRIYIDEGLNDEYKDSSRTFETRLSSYSYPHEWHLNVGGHSELYWQTHLVDYLLWYDQGWVANQDE
jgi:enterochelin esterase-like enzyme